ncbi:MAG: metalloendopeptidase, partial [Acidobacteria bacterium]
MCASVAVAVVFAFAGPLRAQSSADLDFLAGLPDFTRVRSMLPDYLNHLAMALLEKRCRAVGQWSSADDVRRRKAYLRERMVRALGGFPERTPLHARTVGVLERSGYKIEKIVFESQPGFYVTANLYLPTTGQPPFSGVLFPLGHERGGKSNAT